MSQLPHHAVFDCVVFAQALINPKGPAAICIEYVRRGKVHLFVSDYVLDEIRELPSKIPAKYGVTLEQTEEFSEEIIKIAIRVTEIPTVYLHPHDPDDAHYVNLAIATNSSLIVSRDKHLLNLMDLARAEAREFRKMFPALLVLPPDQFASQLRREEMNSNDTDEE